MKTNKSQAFSVRCTPSELRSLDDLVSDLNRSVVVREGKELTRASLLRVLLRFFSGLGPLEFDSSLHTQAVRMGVRQLSNLGNNLNQLTKAYHEGLIHLPVDASGLLEELKDAVQQLNKSQKSYLRHHVKRRELLLNQLLASYPTLSQEPLDV